MSDSDIPAPQTPPTYTPDAVTIYGVKLNESPFAYGEVKASASTTPVTERVAMRMELWAEATPKKGAHQLGSNDCSIVVAYGYSYEGHCYRFDKPRLLLFRDADAQPAIGCGFDTASAGATPYLMWQLRADQPLLEVQTSVATVQSLVLDANLPGKRAPNTYDNDMQMAHRGGRLTRD